jgi:hypothetical protein
MAESFATVLLKTAPELSARLVERVITNCVDYQGSYGKQVSLAGRQRRHRPASMPPLALIFPKPLSGFGEALGVRASSRRFWNELW